MNWLFWGGVLLALVPYAVFASTVVYEAYEARDLPSVAFAAVVLTPVVMMVVSQL